MRRQDIHLMALARQGDTVARCEVGRRYLLGVDGFARHVQMGIEYLTHESVRFDPRAAQIISECLPLQELIEHEQLEVLHHAARAGSAPAQLKLAVWRMATGDRPAEALALLRQAAQQGHIGAQGALHAWTHQQPDTPALAAVLQAASLNGDLEAGAVAMLAAARALHAAAPRRAMPALHAAIEIAAGEPTEAIADLIVRCVAQAEAAGVGIEPLRAEWVEEALDRAARQGGVTAAYMLGRALCGIDCGAIPASALAPSTNVRRGAALLLRAADGGCHEAWMHLYRLHADHGRSVANPEMARFFLEKSADCGVVEAQRRLGALLLRSATTLEETERAMEWLHRASEHGDASARSLLESLARPITGRDEAAATAIRQLQHDDPWLAMRLQLSRAFGLTKLEALCVDPVAGQRPWGLVVGRNPFVMQARRSAPRAVPALSTQAMEVLQRAATLFSGALTDGTPAEGDLRRRSLNQRRRFARWNIDESLFFVNATSEELDRLRRGTKWALHAKDHLELALAA